MKLKILIWMLIGVSLSAAIGFSTLFNWSSTGMPQPTSTSNGAAQPANLTQNYAGINANGPVFSGVIQPGGTAPNFKLPLLNTNLTVSLAQFEGDAVVINFWASWCDQCQLETPLLEKAYQQEKEKGLVILGIDLGNEDTRADALNFMTKFGVTYPLLSDGGDAVARSYFVYGVPISVFISRTGKIQLSHIGGLNQAELQMALSQILGR